MFSITNNEKEVLQALGQQLKRSRLSRKERQSSAAARLGISLPTYRKLEKGDPSVQLGIWVRAVRLFGQLDQLDTLFPTSLFDEAEGRQRAPRRKS